jgi:isochorismate pyruvate lyase
LRWHAAALYARGMTEIRDPEDCTTMTEVRAGVDALDRDLIALLARRFGYMRAAARIKPDRSMVRDEARKTQVIDNAVVEAERVGVPASLVATLWEDLVEASIAYEGHHFDTLRR